MKLIRNHLLVLIIIISVIVIMMTGCTEKQGDNNSLEEEDVGLADSIVNGEMQKRDSFTLTQLRDLLDKSTSIEVKNLDNQIIGKISTGEKINKVVEDIFAHSAIDNYEHSSAENLVATVNFYPASSEPIYGLIKDKFIYIEGYYFTSKNNSIQKIVDYFETNTEEEPIVGD
ncbi:hypothetical protein [Alkaliphilus sp. B6464]|uniref:hypothetical protein n=1 Tax=Alkaliphilus sp. B6464 TaxID=2731219 RepID=UPI001BA627BA|nr:hypothetical protein [Alkaliphilus sp. B6464]QUH20993.1 hypothetical protein HYG84_14640 [Alkaliphilus sp. B6464]